MTISSRLRRPGRSAASGRREFHRCPRQCRKRRAQAATGPVGVNWDGIPLVNNTFNGTAGDDIADGVSPLISFGGNEPSTATPATMTSTARAATTHHRRCRQRIVTGGAGDGYAVFAGPIGNYSFDTVGTNISSPTCRHRRHRHPDRHRDAAASTTVNYGMTAGTNTGTTAL